MDSEEFFMLERQLSLSFKGIISDGSRVQVVQNLYEDALAFLWPDHFDYSKEPDTPPRLPEGVSDLDLEELAENLWFFSVKATLLLAPEFSDSYSREIAGIRLPVLAYLYRFIPPSEWSESAVDCFRQAQEDSREIHMRNRVPNWLQEGFQGYFTRGVENLGPYKVLILGMLQSLSALLFRGVAGEIHIGGTCRPLILDEDLISDIEGEIRFYLNKTADCGPERNLLRAYIRILRKLHQDRSQEALVAYRKMAAEAMRQVPYFQEYYPEPRTRIAMPPSARRRRDELDSQRETRRPRRQTRPRRGGPDRNMY